MELVKNWDVVGQVISYKSGFLTTSSLFDIFCVTEQVDRSSNLSFEMAEDGFIGAFAIGKLAISIED